MCSKNNIFICQWFIVSETGNDNDNGDTSCRTNSIMFRYTGKCHPSVSITPERFRGVHEAGMDWCKRFSSNIIPLVTGSQGPLPNTGISAWLTSAMPGLLEKTINFHRPKEDDKNNWYENSSWRGETTSQHEEPCNVDEALPCGDKHIGKYVETLNKKGRIKRSDNVKRAAETICCIKIKASKLRIRMYCSHCNCILLIFVGSNRRPGTKPGSLLCPQKREMYGKQKTVASKKKELSYLLTYILQSVRETGASLFR